MTTRVGGAILVVTGELWFVPTVSAERLLPVPRFSSVPGAAKELLGIALVDGDVLPVIAIGEGRGTMLVCNYLGERIGLVGHDGAETGTYDFDALTGGVVVPGRTESENAIGQGQVIAKSLDLASIYARARATSWAARPPSPV